MKLFAALSMLFGAQACTAGGQCSCPTRGFSKTTALDGTYCYTRVANPVSYDEAKAACIQLNENATLPLVNSAEDLVAWSDLTSNRYVNHYFAINLNPNFTPILVSP